MEVQVEGEKYTYVFNNGDSYVLRHGEPWRDVVGDKFIYCMAAEIERLRKERDELLALVPLLIEIRATFEMWKDVAPAVSLCADIDKAIASVKGAE